MGGTEKKTFGYSAPLAIAAHHRDTDDAPPKAYPQLCLDARPAARTQTSRTARKRQDPARSK
ncbi:hypothetical protein AB0O07_21905 [Streptomyces sp. NPDC093085]|uniref:hypothetical protein n=1 Tax=Streptomyces sp. NPDC093085 TaxID=3155068 RepID=UPI00342CF304